MIYFFDGNGMITRCASISHDEAHFIAQDSEQWIQSTVVVSDVDYFVFNGAITQFPTKPSNYHEWDWPSLSWVLPARAVSNARTRGAATIDAAAGRARSRYITTVPGQDATYTVKYAEALDYIAAGYPSDLSPYPFIAGESQPNAWMTPTQAATRIATLGGYWREVVGPAIEGARINGKDALDSLTDPAAIDAHVAAVVANLDAI
mgnify:CR=1 FL=1